MKYLLSISTLLTPFASIAHSGHGEESLIHAHTGEIVVGIVIGCILFAGYNLVKEHR